jgi:hypothetical protein
MLHDEEAEITAAAYLQRPRKRTAAFLHRTSDDQILHDVCRLKVLSQRRQHLYVLCIASTLLCRGKSDLTSQNTVLQGIPSVRSAIGLRLPCGWPCTPIIF